MGLIKFIREQLPEPLDKVSKELKLKCELIERISRAVPKCYKNRYHYRTGFEKAQIILKSWERGAHIYTLIDMSRVSDLTKWKELEQKARNYQQQCV